MSCYICRLQLVFHNDIVRPTNTPQQVVVTAQVPMVPEDTLLTLDIGGDDAGFAR